MRFAGIWRIDRVAPYAGAWIEIFDDYNDVTEEESLPTRERGLKSCHCSVRLDLDSVAPYAGAWIEILLSRICRLLASSLPTRERGLKSLIPVERSNAQSRSLRGSVD